MESFKARAKRLWDFFKLTVSQWDRILSHQGGVCFICGRKNKNGKRLSTDHSHQSGLIRGLLCQQCNRVLGKVEDPRWQWGSAQLRRAADYLDNPPAVAALGKEIFTYPGKLGTKTFRKWLKKQRNSN